MLRPQPVNRVANAALGVAIAVFGGAMLLEGVGAVRAGIVLVPIGVYLAYRGYRLGIETRADSITVRGLLRNVTIRRSSVQGITDFPAIAWTNESGRKRWTPVTAFTTPPGTLGSVSTHHSDCIRRLRKWAAK